MSKSTIFIKEWCIRMSGLDTMSTRLKYAGGNRQVDRMNEDKLRSLKKALLY